jgi:hypothetical protein
MATFIRDGGVAMLFLLGFGFVTLAMAGRHAFRPSVQTFRVVCALGMATGFATITGTSAGLAKVAHAANEIGRDNPELVSRLVFQGISEVLGVVILGCAILAASSLLVALGFHREDA